MPKRECARRSVRIRTALVDERRTVSPLSQPRRNNACSVAFREGSELNLCADAFEKLDDARTDDTVVDDWRAGAHRAHELRALHAQWLVLLELEKMNVAR